MPRLLLVRRRTAAAARARVVVLVLGLGLGVLAVQPGPALARPGSGASAAGLAPPSSATRASDSAAAMTVERGRLPCRCPTACPSVVGTEGSAGAALTGGVLGSRVSLPARAAPAR